MIYKILFNIIIVLTIFLGLFQRFKILNSQSFTGGDFNTHKSAVEDFITGYNPYEFTVYSYSILDRDPGNKGYAYLPGILYINTLFYSLSLYSRGLLNVGVLMQIPGLISIFLISILLIKLFYHSNKKVLIFSLILLFFHPYFYLKRNLEGYDMVPIALSFWALYYLKKDSVISGALFSLSVIFKTFPIIFFPIFIFLSRDRLKFIISGAVVGLVFSFPFLKSLDDFTLYLKGSLLVHGDRFVQGRPFLYYLSYYFDIIFIRLIPFKIYSFFSIFGAWIITTIAYLYFKIKNQYILSLLAFLNFYFFTPVLNRTYVFWVLPFLIVGSFEAFKKRPLIFYAINIFYWIFIYWYLAQWKDGFHIHAKI